jgi:hypothetical protein
MRRRSLALAVALGTAGVLAFTAGAPAAVSLSVGSTTVSFSTTLTGADVASNYMIALTASNSGSTQHNSWYLTVTSTTFTSGGHTLPASATAITGATCTPSCAANSVSYPVAVPAAPTAPAAVTFYNSAASSGTWTVTPTFATTVPGNSFAGTYTSTITTAIVSGP